MKWSGRSVLLLGSGGLRISQAGEFDYAGSQAIKALKEENIRVILINPNIATVQTDPQFADVVYLQPLNVPTVTEIIAKEKPEGILLGFGGQTGLNLGLQLEANAVFAKHQVEVLGTSVNSIRLAEDRALFKTELDKIQIKTAHSFAVHTIQDALIAGEEIGYPLMCRAGFALGGQGSGIVKNKEALLQLATSALASAPQLLIEECLLGWQEIEYEIVRDVYGNTITVCNMENLDPIGIHTGESIVVAPSQTLNNHEYHFLRDIARAVAEHFNIVGECNIQYAFNPNTGDYRVIEINPRLSRSSALASKATGYPLAFVAAKLALGYRLSDIKNQITGVTCAYFEPALDYIVVKIPRWDTQKLKSADRRIGTEMKSIGEVMAIGRSFPEALQKAVGMLNLGAHDLASYPEKISDLLTEIQNPTDRRLFALYQYFLIHENVEELSKSTYIHLWFLHQIYQIARLSLQLSNTSEPWTRDQIQLAKKFGFADYTLAKWQHVSEQAFRSVRQQFGITPVIKQIDTLAGEFAAQTNYLYLTYHGTEHDVARSEDAILVLGSGPYGIGSSVEFDWCAVNTVRTLRKAQRLSVLINSNPETVSTDYDESDRLYFEQLTLERVQDIADFEKLSGIIVSVGGQIANNLASPLAKLGYPILGTSVENIDRAENRERFSSMLSALDIDQPAWISADNLTSVLSFVEAVGYPVLIRPSYVLSGAAMNVVHSEVELIEYLQKATLVSRDYPVVVSQFIHNAKELEVDGVADQGNIVIEAISEHIENAGVHSGDATVVLPPQKIYLATIRHTKYITRQIVKALNISGPFNIQFIAKDNAIKVIECNVRASRSFPFVSKVTNRNFIEIATKVLLNLNVNKHYETLELDYVAVKAPLFSYHRLKGSNPVAHVEMASTGEVACLGNNLLDAFFRSWLATDQKILRPKLLVSVSGESKNKLLSYLKRLEHQGWELYATEGTHDFLSKQGVGSIFVFKVSEQSEPNIYTAIQQRWVDLIINIPSGIALQKNMTDGFVLRRTAIEHNIPLITNLQIALYMLNCLVQFPNKEFPVKSWQEFMDNVSPAPTTPLLSLSFSKNAEKKHDP